MAIRLILDTDIGTDVDDLLALALALHSPELILEGITCVYGDVLLRGRMVNKLLSLAGRADIPLRLGAGKPLLGLQPVYWPGHEGEGLLLPDEPLPDFSSEHAASFIIRTVMDNPGQITLAAIGPLTNIALAISLEPLLVKNLEALWLMGGSLHYDNQFHLPLSEHNLRSDPEAAHIVFNSGAEIHQIPLDITLKTRLEKGDLAAIAANPHSFQQTVVDQLQRFPFFANEGYTFMHDPLLIGAMLQPELVTWQPLHVAIALESRQMAGATLVQFPDQDNPANVLAGVGVDAEGFKAEFLRRVAAAG